MEALRATSGELEDDRCGRGVMFGYAGPQCFPQLLPRLEANEQLAADVLKKEEQAASGEGKVLRQDGTETQNPSWQEGARAQMRDCWLRCDVCHKWRLVDHGCVEALRGEKYTDSRGGDDCLDWKRWLLQAEARYESFVRQHRRE